MQTKVSEALELVPSKFPKLMRTLDNGTIVLFNEPCIGTVIVPPVEGYHRAVLQYEGYYSTTWHMDYFEDFKGKVTLENDAEQYELITK